MRILTIGNSPYNNNSCSRIHASIIKKIFCNKHEVSSLCWNHDSNFWYPDENGYYYEFDNVKIPLNIFQRNSNESIVIYEIIKELKPDVIITIGDIDDFYYMKGVKNFSETKFKWISVLTNYKYPIKQEFSELFEICDGIFCTNEYSNNYKNSDFCYYGSSKNFKNLQKEHVGFNVCLMGLNSQIENIPTVIKCMDILKSMIPELNFYLHSNMFEQGDHDILSMVYDKKYITYSSNTYQSDSSSDENLNEILNNMDVVINVSMNGAVATSMFNAMSCGVIPVLSNTKIHKEIVEKLIKENIGIQKHNLLVDSIEINSVGDCELKIIKPESLIKNIYNIYLNQKDLKSDKNKISNFARNNNRQLFLNKFIDFFNNVISKKDTIHFEL